MNSKPTKCPASRYNQIVANLFDEIKIFLIQNGYFHENEFSSRESVLYNLVKLLTSVDIHEYFSKKRNAKRNEKTSDNKQLKVSAAWKEIENYIYLNNIEGPNGNWTRFNMLKTMLNHLNINFKKTNPIVALPFPSQSNILFPHSNSRICFFPVSFIGLRTLQNRSSPYIPPYFKNGVIGCSQWMPSFSFLPSNMNLTSSSNGLPEMKGNEENEEIDTGTRELKEDDQEDSDEEIDVIG